MVAVAPRYWLWTRILVALFFEEEEEEEEEEEHPEMVAAAATVVVVIATVVTVESGTSCPAQLPPATPLRRLWMDASERRSGVKTTTSHEQRAARSRTSAPWKRCARKRRTIWRGLSHLVELNRSEMEWGRAREINAAA